MSELDKFGALNLRAESEKVKNNYRTHLYRGDVLKRFYGSPITYATANIIRRENLTPRWVRGHPSPFSVPAKAEKLTANLPIIAIFQYIS